jgi:hypothetical protein
MSRAAALAFLVAIPAAAAVDDPVPVHVQALMFKRIFHYDKAIDARAMMVLVAYTDEEALDMEDVVAAFRLVGLSAAGVRAQELTEQVRATAVYLMRGANSPALRQRLLRGKLLTICGAPEMVQAGEASISLARTPDGKPQIVVNVRRARDEGHELSSELLRLSRLVP